MVERYHNHEAIIQTVHELSGRIVQVHSRQDESDTGSAWTIARFRAADGSQHQVAGWFTREDVEARALSLRGHYRRERRGRRVVRVFHADLIWRGPVGAWVDPPPVEGIVAFLADGGLTGHRIGPKTAERMAAELGTGLWGALTSRVDLLSPYVRGEDSALAVHQALGEQGLAQVNAICRLMMLKLSLKRARRILEHLGLQAYQRIEADPYLISSVPGIAFATADDIARERMGVPPEDPRRLRAMAASVLVAQAHAGSTSMRREEAIAAIADLAERDVSRISAEKALEQALLSEALIEDGPDVYLPGMLANEKQAAESTARVLQWEHFGLPPEALNVASAAMLTEEQRAAVAMILSSPLSLTLGAPGTGKTSIVRAVSEAAVNLCVPVTLAATTGIAADRMDAALGGQGAPNAATIHSILGPRDRPRPLPEGLIVVDELSMLDLDTYTRLIRAVAGSAGRTRLALLGDPEQLQSVMPGAVARDISECPEVPSVRLTQVWRQDRNTLTGINAERIRRGKFPVFHDSRIGKGMMGEINGYFAGEPMAEAEIRRNAFFLRAESTEDALQKVRRTCLRWQERGYDVYQDVMVISPVRDGTLGTVNLNRELQQALNPEGAPLERPARGRGRVGELRDVEGLAIRAGDPVFQTRNDREGRKLSNGMRGKIIGQKLDGTVVAEFPDRGVVVYTPSQVREELMLAYANTIHKAQGNQQKVTVMVLHHSEHYINLNRPLVLVGHTRATEQFVAIGTDQAYRIALRNTPSRHTRLAPRIRHECSRLRIVSGEIERTLPQPGRAGIVSERPRRIS
jgi:exodeoxyribonuclease V alpha subunit